MPRKLQFAFLGCHCSYLASVTYVNQSNSPYKAPDVRVHGLPTSFVKNYLSFSKNRYISNIRGHDCFAFLGHWTNGVEGSTDRSAHMLAEMDSLRANLVRDREDNNFAYKEEDLLLSFGPTPGSYFADIRRLNRYRWNRLPETLKDFLQLGHPHGTIFDIAINSNNGWVMQMDKGRVYEWDGSLPDELRSALEEGRKRKAAIRNLYLNHQNSADYVLLFTDAFAHVSLHHGFEKDIHELVKSLFVSRLPCFLSWMFPKPKEVKWKFISSCNCDENNQRQINAEYYNQRGRFLLQRSDANQALVYMREAHHLNVLIPSKDRTIDIDYRDDYYMALVAVSEHDLSLFDGIPMYDPSNTFRNEYALVKDKIQRGEMKARKQNLIAEVQHKKCPREWSYKKPPPLRILQQTPEMDGKSLIHEMDDAESRKLWRLREISKQRADFWG